MDYKKILEGVVDIINTTEKSDIGFANICSYIGEKCPELKESEDDRIRKALMQNLKERFGTKGNMGEGLDMPDVLAWLEKQGKQKPNYCHHEVDLSECSEEYRKAYYDGWNNCNMQHSQCKSELDDVVKCLINGMKFYYEDNKEATWGTDKWSMPVKHIIEVLEKQGEQKDILEDATLDNNEDGLIADTIKAKGEQKSAWSEEDDKILGKCIDAASGYYSPEDKQIMKDWLQSLKDRVQPRKEWSEEDERIKNNLLSELTNLSVRKLIEKETEKKYASWLKSLRPQSQWKPSDEQLISLSEAINDYDKRGIFASTLRGLFEQLKKL